MVLLFYTRMYRVVKCNINVLYELSAKDGVLRVKDLSSEVASIVSEPSLNIFEGTSVRLSDWEFGQFLKWFSVETLNFNILYRIFVGGNITI